MMNLQTDNALDFATMMILFCIFGDNWSDGGDQNDKDSNT